MAYSTIAYCNLAMEVSIGNSIESQPPIAWDASWCSLRCSCHHPCIWGIINLWQFPYHRLSVFICSITGPIPKKIPSKPVSSFSPNFQPDSAGVIWWVFLRKKFWIFLCPWPRTIQNPKSGRVEETVYVPRKILVRLREYVKANSFTTTDRIFPIS
jgi:hypothetical protein